MATNTTSVRRKSGSKRKKPQQKDRPAIADVRRISPGSAVVTVTGPRGRPQTFWIPVDKKGNIPQDVAIARLMDVVEGDRHGRERNYWIDLAIDAKTVAPAKPKSDEERLLQYLWWVHPNQSDIDGVDTTDSKWGIIDGNLKKRVAVAIVGANEGERAAVLEVIKRNFTNHERRQMKGLVIEVKPSAGRGVAGYYQWSPRGVKFDRMVIGRRYLFHDPDEAGPNKGSRLYDRTVTHELVHLLRHRDEKRRGHVSGRGFHDDESDFDSDVEEVFTDAETLSRMRTAPDRSRTGYYSYIPGAGKDTAKQTEGMVHDKQLLMNVRRGDEPRVAPRIMAREVRSARIGERARTEGFDSKVDRDQLVGKMFQGKKGLNAVKAVDARFPHLKIATARIKGDKAEAVDTYYRLKGRIQGKKTTIYTHILSPKGASTERTREKIAAPLPGGTLTEFQDGKAVKVGASSNKMAAGSTKVPNQKSLDRAVRRIVRS